MKWLKEHILMIRTTTLLAIVLLLGASSASARKVEITPFWGFQFGGDFNDLDVEDGDTYGLLVDFALSLNSQVELMYNRQDTALQQDRLFGPDLFDLEYYHLGFLYQWTPGQMRPFLVASLGATRLDSEGLEGETRFSWSLGGGVKMLVNNHFGFRFEGRFNQRPRTSSLPGERIDGNER